MPDPEERPVGSLHHSGRLDLAHCFFDLRGCFWSVVHPLTMAGAAKVGKQCVEHKLEEKNTTGKADKNDTATHFRIHYDFTERGWRPVAPYLPVTSTAIGRVCVVGRNCLPADRIIYGKMYSQ